MSVDSVTVSDTANDPHPGDVVRVSAAFLNEALAGEDPSTVTLNIRLAGGSTTSYVYGVDAEVERDSAGNFHADLSIPEIYAQARLFRYEWVGTGGAASVHAAGESAFRVIDPFGYAL